MVSMRERAREQIAERSSRVCTFDSGVWKSRKNFVLSKYSQVPGTIRSVCDIYVFYDPINYDAWTYSESN